MNKQQNKEACYRNEPDIAITKSVEAPKMCSVKFLLLIQLCLASSSVHETNTVLQRADLLCYQKSTIIKAELSSLRLSLSEIVDIDKIHRNASKCLIRSKKMMRHRRIIKQPNLQLRQKTTILHPFKIWISKTLTNAYYTLRNGFSFQCSKTNQIATSRHSSLQEKFNILTFGPITSQNLKKGVCLMPRRKNLLVIAKENATLDYGIFQELDEHTNLNETVSKEQSNVKTQMVFEEWFYHFLLILRLNCQSGSTNNTHKQHTNEKVIFEQKSSSSHLLTSPFKQQPNVQVINASSSHKRLNDSAKEIWYRWFRSVLQLTCQRSILFKNLKSKTIVTTPTTHLKGPVILNDSLSSANSTKIEKNSQHLNASLNVQQSNDSLVKTVNELTNLNSKQARNFTVNVKFGVKRYLKQPGYVRNVKELIVLIWLLLLLTRLWPSYLPETDVTPCDLKNNKHQETHVEENEEKNIDQRKVKVSSIPAAVLAARSKLALELLVAVVEISPYPCHPIEAKIT